MIDGDKGGDDSVDPTCVGYFRRIKQTNQIPTLQLRQGTISIRGLAYTSTSTIQQIGGKCNHVLC